VNSYELVMARRFSKWSNLKKGLTHADHTPLFGILLSHISINAVHLVLFQDLTSTKVNDVAFALAWRATKSNE
jgi:hypothetical protein